jgi:hypothetical protein
MLPDSISHVAFIGATGSGKTEAVLRFCVAHLSLPGDGWKVVVIDGKEDPETGHRLMAAARDLGIKDSMSWPDAGPMDFFRGSPSEILDRCLSLVTFTEPFYESVATTALRLAIDDRRGAPRSMAELIARLDPTSLKASWAGTPRAGVVAGLTAEQLRGVAMRYFGINASLEELGAVPSEGESGGWSFEDSPVIWATLPTSRRPVIAASLGRILLVDFTSYLRNPTRRTDPRKILLVIEELGAIMGQSDEMKRTVLEVLERARSAGCRVLLSGQSEGSFGDEAAAKRIFRSGSAVFCMRMPMPEDVLSGLGTREAVESSLGVTSGGVYLDQGSARIQAQYAIPPDAIRRLPVGRGYLIHQGLYSLVQVVQIPGSMSDSPAAMY